MDQVLHQRFGSEIILRRAMSEGQPSPQHLFNGVVGVQVKISFGQGRQAFKAKLIVGFQHIASTAFAYMRKDQVQKRIFYFFKQWQDWLKLEKMTVHFINTPHRYDLNIESLLG